MRNTGLIDALSLLGPRLLTMFGIQLIVIARDNLASRLDQTGAVTSLTYGWMIMQVPETLLGTAIATAMLPTLAEFAARQEWSAFRETVERALRVLIALTIPVAAVLATGIDPLVRAVFGFEFGHHHPDHLDDARVSAHPDRLRHSGDRSARLLCAQRAHVSPLRSPDPDRRISQHRDRRPDIPARRWRSADCIC